MSAIFIDFIITLKMKFKQFKNILSSLNCSLFRQINTETQAKEFENVLSYPSYFNISTDVLKCNQKKKLIDQLSKDMIVYDNFLSLQDENNILEEIEPFLKKMRYEFDHWDDAIHGYRETERLKWNGKNTEILDKVRKIAFRGDTAPLKHVHILDLDKNGYIKPHIDAVRFCGDTIAGISLLTDCVMRLVNDAEKTFFVDILLKRRSLYIMKDDARYNYTHEILKNELSIFRNEKVDKDRRISVICRNEPKLS